MSDEQKFPASAWGTIFTPHGEHALGGVEHTRSTNWTEQDELAYLERVRQKASQLGAQIIAGARGEADDIRRLARQEGYDAGLAEARDELDAFRSGMAESVSSVLGAIEGQCSHIFEQWREDIVELVRLAVRRIAGVELAEQRDRILASLLDTAVGLLEKRRELVIRVNPEDEPAINDIVGFTRERFPDVKSWRVRADVEIEPGGMVVESESSLAEGRVESRIAAVDEMLRQLTLPDKGEPETDA